MTDNFEVRKEKKIACPLLNVFACGQVSSPRLYRLKQSDYTFLFSNASLRLTSITSTSHFATSATSFQPPKMRHFIKKSVTSRKKVSFAWSIFSDFSIFFLTKWRIFSGWQRVAVVAKWRVLIFILDWAIETPPKLWKYSIAFGERFKQHRSSCWKWNDSLQWRISRNFDWRLGWRCNFFYFIYIFNVKI